MLLSGYLCTFVHCDVDVSKANTAYEVFVCEVYPDGLQGLRTVLLHALFN